MALVRGDGIVAVAPDVVGAATALLDRLVDADRELVTVLTGVDADEATTAALAAWLAANRPGVEVEVHARRPAAVPVPLRRGVSGGERRR